MKQTESLVKLQHAVFFARQLFSNEKITSSVIIILIRVNYSDVLRMLQQDTPCVFHWPFFFFSELVILRSLL